MSSSHWLMRWSSFNIWVVRVAAQKDSSPQDSSVLAEALTPLRGAAPSGSLVLEKRFLSAEQREKLKPGGQFIIFAPPMDHSNGSLNAVWAEPASEERVEAIKKQLPKAYSEQLWSGCLLALLATLPLACLASQLSLRKSSSAMSQEAIKGRALASFFLCVLEGALLCVYEALAPTGFAPRLDIVALAPLYCYSAWAAKNFLSVWVNGPLS